MIRRIAVLIILALAAFGGQTGAHAQNETDELSTFVTAQGVVSFTGDSIDWRVYEIEADPENPRDAVTAAAGFTLVDDGGLIVLDANSGREALLSTGEAAFSADGELLVINTEGGETARYRRIVLMPDDYVDDEARPAAFESPGFTIAAGKREVEFSVGVLTGGDQVLTVPVEEAVLLTVLAGEIDIDGAPESLEAGSYWSAGSDFDLTSTSGATIAIVSVGTTVRDVTLPIPDEDVVPTEPDPVDEELPTITPEAGIGSLILQPQICSLGGSTGGCTNQPDAAYLVVSGGGLANPISTRDIAANSDGTFTLWDLPYGDYYVVNLDIDKGSFEVVGGYQDPNQPDVYIVSVGPDNPVPVVSVRLLPPVGNGIINVNLYACPIGLPGHWAQPWLCWVQYDGWTLSLTSDAFAGPILNTDAPATNTGYTFMGLPQGYEYRISVDAFPDPFVEFWVDPDYDVEGPVRVYLSAEYSVQTYNFYAVNPADIDPTAGVDTDGDLLSDEFEVNVLGTNPMLTDSDGDNVWDRRELDTGTNPLDPESYWFG